MASNRFFAFLEEVKESQRDPDHFKFEFGSRVIHIVDKPKGFYFGTSDRVRQTPRIFVFDYSKLEERLVSHGAI